YAYSTSGALTSASDALGHHDEYEYDEHRRMIAATLKNGVRFQYAYEGGTGRCARTWGPRGLHALELQADRQARTTTIVSEEPKVYTWNDDGLVVREATLGGETLLERAYDEDALLIAESNGRGEGRQIWYDERGNR